MKSAISVKGISKQYVLGSEAIVGQNFREMLIGAITSPFKRLSRLRGKDKDQEKFWALHDISFEVMPGEVVGIIGRNGAGKSTLLKVLSRITTPTKGEVRYKGRVASLLEVGTGFHPELTGRENIYLNGAILGMTRVEITQRMDEIIEFAGVEKFLDTPVKRYSSGMYVRLAFSVAAHLDPDILIVDEILSVGDSAFQDKCINKMSEVSAEGRTVIFVSHNLTAIRKLCTSIKIIDHGQLVFEGNVADGLAAYDDRIEIHNESVKDAHYNGNLADVISFKKIQCTQNSESVTTIDTSYNFIMTLDWSCSKNLQNLDLNIQIFKEGINIFTLYDTTTHTDLKKGNYNSVFEIQKNKFTPGRYTISVGAVDKMRDWIWGKDIASIVAINTYSKPTPDRAFGVVNIEHKSKRVSIK